MSDDKYTISMIIVSYLVMIGYLQLALQSVPERGDRDVIYDDEEDSEKLKDIFGDDIVIKEKNGETREDNKRAGERLRRDIRNSSVKLEPQQYTSSPYNDLVYDNHRSNNKDSRSVSYNENVMILVTLSGGICLRDACTEEGV
jgi:hypothetical protein